MENLQRAVGGLGETVWGTIPIHVPQKRLKHYRRRMSSINLVHFFERCAVNDSTVNISRTDRKVSESIGKYRKLLEARRKEKKWVGLKVRRSFPSFAVINQRRYLDFETIFAVHNITILASRPCGCDSAMVNSLPVSRVTYTHSRVCLRDADGSDKCKRIVDLWTITFKIVRPVISLQLVKYYFVKLKVKLWFFQ